MLQFHDWLRGNAGDRRLYERVKRELTGQAWASVQQYADARTAVIGAILAGHTAPTHCRKGSPHDKPDCHCG
jgi:GrpB-like predicted nucleotidyltransferase (UPF0157 family)